MPGRTFDAVVFDMDGVLCDSEPFIAAAAAEMLRRARGKPIRIASKSIRSGPILERLLALDRGFQGSLCFTLPETLWLWERGLRDLVIAYPSTDRPGLTRLEAGRVPGDRGCNLGLAPRARIGVGTMRGDVTLQVPADVSARIEASTFSGSIRSDIGTVEEEEHGPGSSLKATAGSGQGSINLESFSGDIELRKR